MDFAASKVTRSKGDSESIPTSRTISSSSASSCRILKESARSLVQSREILALVHSSN